MPAAQGDIQQISARYLHTYGVGLDRNTVQIHLNDGSRVDGILTRHYSHDKHLAIDTTVSSGDCQSYCTFAHSWDANKLTDDAVALKAKHHKDECEANDYTSRLRPQRVWRPLQRVH